MEVVGPKWEDLNMDCLVNILGRVGIENLLLDVPYVCKSWYKVTLNPQCWSILDFTQDSTQVDAYGFPPRLKEKFDLHLSEFCTTAFIKNVANRGNKFVSYVKVPALCTPKALAWLYNVCPNLKTLKLHYSMKASSLPSIVSKWKRLEYLSLHATRYTNTILEQVGVHCKNFEALEVNGGLFSIASATSIVNLPNLKSLTLKTLYIRKEELLCILNGCKKLKYLGVWNCDGFHDNDADIIKFASQKETFKLLIGRPDNFDSEEDDYIPSFCSYG